MPTLRQCNKSVYWAWKSMKQRCFNPKCLAYKNYGARGITVCDEWLLFEPFCEWALSNGYQKGLDLDRIDNDGNYEPSNCRWATRQENTNNRRKTVFVTIDGVKRPLEEWGRLSGIPSGSLSNWKNTRGLEYMVSRIKYALDNGYDKKPYVKHYWKIVNTTTNEVFNSLREAERHYGLCKQSISNSVKNNSRTRVGCFALMREEEE